MALGLVLWSVGPWATDTGLAYAPVTQGYGHGHRSHSTLFRLAALQRELDQLVERGGGGGDLIKKQTNANQR